MVNGKDKNAGSEKQSFNPDKGGGGSTPNTKSGPVGSITFEEFKKTLPVYKRPSWFWKFSMKLFFNAKYVEN